ncbi:MAG TPA: rhomboid family intramembrane serine protease [Terracidiphilus sp.]|nr:rhomboid family intramembrane serine protease [Terracidiphilus sp.]
MFVLPVNRDRAPDHSQPVTLALLVLNSGVWAILAFAGMNADAVQEFGLRPAHWTLLTAFTHMFLHAGFWHVAGNMYFLWMFARKLEERLGSALFFLTYLVSGVAAAGAHTLFSLGSNVPLVGASGAISGVAGMYFVLFPRSPFDLQIYLGWWRVKSVAAQTRGAVGTWIGEQFLLGLITSTLHSAGIAFWAHVGGFACGFLMAAIIASRAPAIEQQAILHPEPLTEGEKDEIQADRVEQPSELTTLKLS